MPSEEARSAASPQEPIPDSEFIPTPEEAAEIKKRLGVDNSAAPTLRCSVCGEEPGWSFPHEGDPCWNDDDGKLVSAEPRATGADTPGAGESFSAAPTSPERRAGVWG